MFLLICSIAQAGAFAAAGLGLPELIHVEAGAYVHPRMSIEAHYGNVVFNHLIGAGVTGHLLGEVQEDRPPRHSLLMTGHVVINPTPPITLAGGGETIGAALLTAPGYGLVTDGGFLLRVRVGALFYEDDGFAAGPHFSLGAGYTR